MRRAALVVAILVGATLASTAAFHGSCHRSGPDDPPYGPPNVQRWRDQYPDFQRTEESTYLTLPEWYEVFSYQEQAEHLESGKPSDFRWFAAIGQFWDMYCHAYGPASAGYAANPGNHLMIGVIGVSFTLEYAAKGLHEMTWGWLTEHDSYRTQEDGFAAETARDYGRFIETKPWYEYPFGKRMVGVWTETDLFGHDMLRKTERKMWLTAEYGVKAVYGLVIRGATGLVFGEPPAKDYVWMENATEASLAVPGVEVAQPLGNGSYLVVLPHYQGFTDAMPELARQGVTFADVAGNDLIVLTATGPDEWVYDLPAGRELWRQDLLTDPSSDRLVIETPVRDLAGVLNGLQQRGVRVEHLFDY
ncbi:MAG TPA: hypothetical protein VM327_06715 [Candidatus Thermoplasmatota archaeon]|nr:hypothetical protein [Candidatus Thermoplasmatota archaeon]